MSKSFDVLCFIQALSLNISIFGLKIYLELLQTLKQESFPLSFAFVWPHIFCTNHLGKKQASLLIVWVLLVYLAFLFETQDIWNNKCHLMLCAILNSSSGFRSGVEITKSSSNLNASQVVLSISLSQRNRLNYGTSKFATLFF